MHPFPKESNFQNDDLLTLIHSDLCGPINLPKYSQFARALLNCLNLPNLSIRVPSLGGSRYFATFVDDTARYIQISFIKTKDEVENTFVKYKVAVENRLGKKLKILRTDIENTTKRNFINISKKAV